MKRRLFAILSALSLLLCVALSAFRMGGSVWSPNAVVRRSQPFEERRFAVVVRYGALMFEVLTPTPAREREQKYEFRLGFGYADVPVFAGGNPPVRLGSMSAVVIPFWFLALATVALPLWYVVSAIRARMAVPPGRCPACGYDLRATPQRCPECGREPPAPAAEVQA